MDWKIYIDDPEFQALNLCSGRLKWGNGNGCGFGFIGNGDGLGDGYRYLYGFDRGNGIGNGRYSYGWCNGDDLNASDSYNSPNGDGGSRVSWRV